MLVGATEIGSDAQSPAAAGVYPAMPSLEPGKFLHQRLQGTEATYRVIHVEREIVLVEVVDAPGLAAGYRFRILLAAAEAMEVRDAPRAAPPQEE